MKILTLNNDNYYNSDSSHRCYSQVAFEGIVRPSKLIKTKGSLNKRFQVFWIDIKRNYCVYDFEKSGCIKNNSLLNKPVLKQIFDFCELKLKNFHKVSDKYYRGGIITCEYDILRLKKKGITDIISLVESQKYNQKLVDFAKQQGINYHHLELLPPYGIPQDSQINEFFNIIQESKGSIYVHCLHGKDRTGFMTFLYEMDFLKTKPQKAIKNMIKYGMNAKKNHQMIKYLAKRYPEFSNELKSHI